ncbi:UNVERIFIED_CONTAM: hypothetical protein PYX00_006095 [Menopon gallinae]|uniref:mRNA cap guanine-N(7) methyltransferase n=1 Tax=Menopon gallinae TaxID=328185 RepID=A0AAW2HV16_9NEOP
MEEASTSVRVPVKHKLEDEGEDEEVVNKRAKEIELPDDKFSSHVADHYNKIENTGLKLREQSKIFYLRNFNNWIKGCLIDVYLHKTDRVQNVLDLCCGKGGDLLKWIVARIRHLVCADIAWKCIEQCESRYRDFCNRNQRIFTCEFITADCSRARLKEKYRDPEIQFDLVSCQFSFHYCFESLPQAERMLQNATECLKLGGYFIGTIPCANEIVKRIKKSGSKLLKSKMFSIEMYSEEPYPLFGAKYDFHLDSVVQCPEFLVHFPTFVRLAEKYGLVLDHRSSFAEFYEKYSRDEKKRFILKKMCALEQFSLRDEDKISSYEYEYAEKCCREKDYNGIVGTLSKSEWEAISLYQVFAFKKVRNYQFDENGVKLT